MTKKKTTKQIRAIDRIIKFQIDDGIESLTIGGKEALADLEIDRNSNVTLYVNADKDKVNEIKSLVPFVNVAVKETGADPDKSKAVTLSQDLTKFALELAEDSKQLAEIIKTETSLTIDFAQLITRLNTLSTAVDKAERNSAQALAKAEKVEREQVEQAKVLTGIVTDQTEQGNQLANLLTKDQEQDNKMLRYDSKIIELGARVDTHEISLNNLDGQISNQKLDIIDIQAKQLAQDNKLATLEQASGTSVDLTPLEQRIATAESIASGLGIQIANIEQIIGQAKQLYTVINGYMSDSIDNLPDFSIYTDIPSTKTIEIAIHTKKGIDSALISNGVILENNLKRFTLRLYNENYNFEGVSESNNVYTGDVTVIVKIYEFTPVEHYQPNINKIDIIDF